MRSITRTSGATSAVASALGAAALAATLSPAATAAARPALVEVTYPGAGVEVHADDVTRRLGDTDRSFRQFATSWLERQDRQAVSAGGDECAGSATMVVKRFRSDGYAWVANMGRFAPCPSGGYYGIAVMRSGDWSFPKALRGQ